MADSIRKTEPTIKLNGTALQENVFADLVEGRIERSIHLLDRCELRFHDHDFELIDDETRFKIGTPLEVQLVAFTEERAEAAKTAFKGEITSFGLDQRPDGRHELVVVAYSKGHRLARGTQVKTYLNKKDSEIANEIAQRHGLSASVDATSTLHDYLAQHDTDLAFLSERAEANGYQWWVDDATLYFKKREKVRDGPTLTFGTDLARFRVRMSGEPADTVQVDGWDAATQKRITANATIASMPPDAPTRPDGKAAFGKATRIVGHLPVQDQNEATVRARAFATMTQSEQVIARGEAVEASLITPGEMITVEGVGTTASGKYLVTSVTHVWAADRPFVTRFESGGAEPAELADLLGRGSTAHNASPAWGRHGLVIGIVTNNNDPENLGRVKVKFPTLSEQDESHWARVLSPGAAAGEGYTTIPEVNAEVLVAFEHGDIRRPVVLGGLWSSKNKPPMKTADVVQSGKVIAYQMKTGAGHTMTIGKIDNEEQFELKLADGSSVLKLGANEVVLETKKPLKLITKDAATVEATKDLILKGMNVKIEAKQKVTLKGPAGLEGESTATTKMKGTMVEIEGTAMAKLKGAMVNVEASGIAAVKGAQIMLG